jgi:hypothetical protein
MLTSKPNAKLSLEESLNVVPNENGTPQYVRHIYSRFFTIIPGRISSSRLKPIANLHFSDTSIPMNTRLFA